MTTTQGQAASQAQSAAATDLPDIERQYEQARTWAQLFRNAGYSVNFSYTDTPAPFDREWQVWAADGSGYAPLASIDIDGCGASWHGDDALWLSVVGAHEGVTA